jgi:hypothetical protein
MRRLPLAVHERLGRWARQLRPRVAGWPVRLVETRSAPELARALAGSACSLGLVDLGDRPLDGLDDLDFALRLAPDALVLVLDPSRCDEVASLARELGAAHVLSGVATPPAVVDLLARWLPLARRRAEAAGWVAAPEPDPRDADLIVAPESM